VYDPGQSDPLAGQLRILRIIHFAFCLGCITFLVIVLFLVPINAPEALLEPFFGYLGAGLAVPVLLAGWLVPLQMDATARKAAVAGKMALEAQFVPRFLVRMGLVEGTAFMQIVFYLLAAGPLNLGMALGALVLLGLMFPTRSGIEEWKANQEERARQESMR
jgi:hypothetical protein